MKNFVDEFKAFAMKGNVVDLAVAIVIGAAFGKIVSSLVTNIITPVIGVLMGGVNFTNMSTTMGKSVITYGVFIQSIFDFAIVAFVIFVVVKAIAKLKEEGEAPKESKPAPTPENIQLLREIRDSLRR